MSDLSISGKIKLLIIDEHTLLRKAIVKLLSYLPDFAILADIASPDDLFKFISLNGDIQVILFRAFSSIDNTCKLLKKINREYPEIQVVCIIKERDLTLVSRMIDVGISGCLCDDSDPSELIFALRCAKVKKIYQNSLFTNALYWKITTTREDPLGSHISDKHRQLLNMLWQEKTTSEISNELCMSVSSIEKMKQFLKEELKVKTVVGLVKYAIKNDIVRPA